MTTFNEREKACEDKYQHDQALQFKVEVRRNKLLGLWVAEMLGLAGAVLWVDIRLYEELPAWWRFPRFVRRFLVVALLADLSLGFVIPMVSGEAHLGGFVAGVPVLGDTHQCTHEAPMALLAMPDIDRAQLPALLEGPLSHYKQIVILPDLFEIPTLWVRSRDIGGVLGLEITSNLLDPLARFLKRTMDLALVLTTLPLWLPLCLVVALAIRLEDGDAVLYFQERLGKNNLPFKTIKFRTMVPEAERILQEKLDSDPALRAEWETHFKLRRDPRITRVGAWLRKTSLDELPQLINVLRGEMSLVGPRPLPEYHQRELAARTQDLRTRLRPGLTGLWQVSGRSDIGTDGMERWDAYYVRNWSVWLDLVILFRTTRAVIKRSGAY
ncbi:MAG: exopolysaccharide biosynthesis polyprenyl glycosylphosphotransferase [Bacteroidetes bacterium]|nr:exopolysaccharide biosynthesis polyprenyl glycosylphosphotransferase [Bacteroidota bacterium]